MVLISHAFTFSLPFLLAITISFTHATHQLTTPHPSLAPSPSPHHHHHHHHHHHIPSPSPLPAQPPTPPVKPPTIPPTTPPAKPPTTPPAKPPTTPPAKPPTTAPAKPPTKPPTTPPAKPPTTPPVKPPTTAPAKPPTKPPTTTPAKPPTTTPAKPPTKPPTTTPAKPPTTTPAKPPTKPPTTTPTKPPTAPPAKPPTSPPAKPLPRKFVAVQGVVYCKNCSYVGVDTLLGASPLAGAKVVLKCRNTQYLIKSSATTDKNGYFFMQAPPLITTYGTRKCHVSLSNKRHEAGTCSNPTNLHGGLTGAPLVLDRTSLTKPLNFTIFTVGPFAYEPPKKCIRL